jgi:hypothetical protein
MTRAEMRSRKSLRRSADGRQIRLVSAAFATRTLRVSHALFDAAQNEGLPCDESGRGNETEARLYQLIGSWQGFFWIAQMCFF